MEFRFRAAEERHRSFRPSTPCSFSSSSAAAGYFADRALQADFVGIGGDVVRPMAAVESLQRLIQKERIREEILREMTQRRILEEEVRRELEIERLTLMRRVPPERFCDPSVGRFMPEMRIRDEIERDLVSRVPVVGFNERLLLDVRPEIRGEGKLPSSLQKNDLERIESSAHVEVKSSEQKLCGTKRKAVADPGAGKLPKPRKDWSCALCQVTATSQKHLNNHLRGKKHKAKLQKLEAGTAFKPKAAIATKEGASTDGLRTLKMQVEGKMHEVLQSKKFLLCKRCNAKCNSTLAMAAHLGGKRHNSHTEKAAPRKDHEPAKTSTANSGEEVEKEPTAEAAKEDDVEKGGTDAANEGAMESKQKL